MLLIYRPNIVSGVFGLWFCSIVVGLVLPLALSGLVTLVLQLLLALNIFKIVVSMYVSNIRTCYNIICLNYLAVIIDISSFVLKSVYNGLGYILTSRNIELKP